jgi:hypothetical protein
MLKSAKGAARTTTQIRSRFEPRSVLRGLIKSAKGAARTTQPIRGRFQPRSVLRGLIKSAKGAAWTTQPIQSRFEPRSVLRGLIKSAKGAARTTQPIRGRFQPHSVLRGLINDLLRGSAAFVLWALAVSQAANAQSSPDLKAILTRLDQMEQQNRTLLQEIHELRTQLAGYEAATAKPDVSERVDVLESRTAELAQTKVEASQRFPISLTGTVLFNAFLNGRFSGTAEDPTIAAASPGFASAGASLRQTTLGFTFNGPSLPGGGKASGSLYMDFFAGSQEPDNNLVHLRVARLDLNWGNTTITFGQDKPIISPRDPTSFAQVGVSPLTGAGNLWQWQPQVRVEHRFIFDDLTGLQAQAGVYETYETAPNSIAKTLAPVRPGYETRLALYHGSDNRRFEIAPGFHFSNTQVSGISIPSPIASLDWLARPVKLLELTGAWFDGRNVSILGALPGLSLLDPNTVIPVHSAGGWSQVALFPTSRISIHFYGGLQNNRVSDLAAGSIFRNLEYAGNIMYKLAPNVITALEVSQTRTTYLGLGERLNNHYDLAIGYLF